MAWEPTASACLGLADLVFPAALNYKHAVVAELVDAQR